MKMSWRLVFILLGLVSAVSSNKYTHTGCIGDGCCPGNKEMYPGDMVTLKTDGSNGGTWCGHQFLVRLKDSVCEGCRFTVKFSDFSTPFTPTIELLEANYTQMAFYGSSFQFLKSLVTFGGAQKEKGIEGKPLPSTFDTTSNILKVSFGNTAGYKGSLTMTVKTKTDFDSDAVIAAVGVSVICVLIIGITVAVVVIKRKRRIDRARRGDPALIAAIAY